MLCLVRARYSLEDTRQLADILGLLYPIGNMTAVANPDGRGKSKYT